MNKGALFCLILAGLGIFLWLQRDEIVAPESGTASGASRAAPSINAHERFIIREKVKPGGYIGWHTTEVDKLTNSAKQTRQASHYYFVCTEMNGGAQRIFLVSASAFTFERVGNVLTAQQVRAFQEVSGIEEPPLPSSYEFRRRENKR